MAHKFTVTPWRRDQCGKRVRGAIVCIGRKRRRSSAKNSDLMLMVMDFGRRPDWGSPIDIAKQWKKEPVSRCLPAPVCESIVQRQQQQQQQQQQNSQNCSFFHCLDIAHFLRRKRLLLRRQFYQAIPTSIFFNVPNKAFIYCRLPSGNESRTFVTGGVSIWSQFVAAKKTPPYKYCWHGPGIFGLFGLSGFRGLLSGFRFGLLGLIY